MLKNEVLLREEKQFPTDSFHYVYKDVKRLGFISLSWRMIKSSLLYTLRRKLPEMFLCLISSSFVWFYTELLIVPPKGANKLLRLLDI